MRGKLLIISTLLTLLWGCRSTRYVPEEKHLLHRVHIETNTPHIKESDARLYLKQRPNLKILGVFRFHLGLYNLSGKDQSKWINRWLRKIGEEPVIYDATEKERSKSELERFFKSKGYINAIVSDTVIYEKKKATVQINVEPKKPYRVRDSYIKSEDTRVLKKVLADSSKSLIKPGIIFDYDVFDKERDRITSLLRSDGYYNFNKTDIEFVVDSNLLSQQITDTLIIKPKIIQNQDGSLTAENHKRYHINDIYIYVPRVNNGSLLNQEEQLNRLDTVTFENYHFLIDGEPVIKPEIILHNILFKKGDIYNSQKIERSHVLLSSIQLIRYVNIRFEEAVIDGQPGLNCFIQLSPNKSQSFSINIEGTNKSGNIGGAGIFSYQHRNLFKGAEVFNMRLRGARETQVGLNSNLAFNSSEYGSETSLTYPKFLFPFLNDDFRNKIKSSTTLNLSYDFQKRPDYDRTIFKSIFGYDWKSQKRVSHSLDILDLNFVRVKNMTEAFTNYIDTLFLKFSYEDHVIHSISYDVTYNNNTAKNSRSSVFLRFGAEAAGNTLYAANSLLGEKDKNGHYTLFNVPFSQYLKFDGEGVFSQYINAKNSIVYRGAFGIAFPYGNLTILPFEKRYFAGGANSVRAWNVRSLGPGTFSAPSNQYYNQTGDLKLEANLEYRFKLFWVLEGAMFVDAGNTWTIRSAESQPGGLFKFDSFFKEIGIGYGLGTRFDFSFFVFRFDMGIKAYDPERRLSDRWVRKPKLRNDAAYHIAIGYPF